MNEKPTIEELRANTERLWSAFNAADAEATRASKAWVDAHAKELAAVAAAEREKLKSELRAEIEREGKV